MQLVSVPFSQRSSECRYLTHYLCVKPAPSCHDLSPILKFQISLKLRVCNFRCQPRLLTLAQRLSQQPTLCRLPSRAQWTRSRALRHRQETRLGHHSQALSRYRESIAEFGRCLLHSWHEVVVRNSNCDELEIQIKKQRSQGAQIEKDWASQSRLHHLVTLSKLWKICNRNVRPSLWDWSDQLCSYFNSRELQSVFSNAWRWYLNAVVYAQPAKFT